MSTSAQGLIFHTRWELQEELLNPLIEGSAHYCLADVSGDFEV